MEPEPDGIILWPSGPTGSKLEACRETDRQRDRYIFKERDWLKQTERDREVGSKLKACRDREKERQTDREIDRVI